MCLDVYKRQGLATGYVKEIYHPDYVAKRMEIGAVMGAAPRRAVQRLTSGPVSYTHLSRTRTRKSENPIEKRIFSQDSIA